MEMTAVGLHKALSKDKAPGSEPEGGATLNAPSETKNSGGPTPRRARERSRGSALSKAIPAMMIVMLLAGLVCAPAPSHAQLPTKLQEAVDEQLAGNLDKAIDLYTQFLQKNPNSPEAYNWRGMAYADKGQLDKALADYDKAISLSPKYGDAFNNRGEIYRKKGDFKRAISDYVTAAQLEPNFAEPWYNAGLAYEALGNTKQAISHYEGYLKLNPNAPDKDAVQAKIEQLKKAPPATKPKPKPQPGQAVKRPGPPQQAQQAVKPGERPPARQRAGAQQRRMQPEQAVPGLPGGIPMTVPEPGPISMAVSLIVYLLFSAMLFLIAKKTNTDMPWMAFIPIAQVFLMVRIAGKPWWWFLVIIFVPLVNIVLYFLVSLGIAQARGKGTLWGVLLFFPCTTPIALIYLAVTK